jgi:hypothetical protein
LQKVMEEYNKQVMRIKTSLLIKLWQQSTGWNPARAHKRR